MVCDHRCVGGSGRAAAHRIVDDAYVAKPRFLPAEPDGGGAIGRGMDAARGPWRGVRGNRCCHTNTHFFSINTRIFKSTLKNI